MKVIDTPKHRLVRSESYNYNFDKSTGYFQRWGKTIDDDPSFAPYPEILDIEITTICAGVPQLDGIRRPCSFCYKANSTKGKNMSFDTFKQIVDNMTFTDGRPCLLQVAFGGDSQATSNPDLLQMMHYLRNKGIIPNITVADLDDNMAKQLAAVVGGIAVSRYVDKNVCYDTVKRLVDNGLKQVNIHQLVSEQTEYQVYETINDRLTDSRLSKLNAIVLLSLKQVGRGITHRPLDHEKFQAIVNYALSKGVGIGFDSCSAFKFLKAVRTHKDFEKFNTLAEPCEATCFSSYIDVEGNYYPCSFAEQVEKPISALDGNFIHVWNSEQVKNFRNRLMDTTTKNDLKCRTCPLFDNV